MCIRDSSIIFGLFGYTVFCILFRLGTSILAGALTTVSYTHLLIFLFYNVLGVITYY